MVGNRITDLLREIKYHPQNTTHFEPIHIQYLPVRNEVVKIVETQMAEINGDLVQFGEGHTILTLHFKREVVLKKQKRQDVVLCDVTQPCQPT